LFAYLVSRFGIWRKIIAERKGISGGILAGFTSAEADLRGQWPSGPFIYLNRNSIVLGQGGDYRIQLGFVPPSGSPALPESPLGEYSIGCLAKEASTDRSSFVANESLRALLWVVTTNQGCI